VIFPYPIPFDTPLGVGWGLGSASHWWRGRCMAIACIPLRRKFICSGNL